MSTQNNIDRSRQEVLNEEKNLIENRLEVVEDRLEEVQDEENSSSSVGERVEGVVREHYRPAGQFTGLLLALYGLGELWTGFLGGVQTVAVFVAVSLVLYTAVTVAQNSRFVRGESDE